MYVQESADEQLDRLTDAINNPQHGDLVITDPCLMKTCAWYVGTVCAEYDANYGWMYMPYARLTEYAKSQEEAQMWLDTMQDFYE